MKKLLFLCLSFMLIFTFMACGDKPSENIGPTCVSCDNLVSNEGDVCSSCKTAGKVALYNKVIGTWNATDDYLSLPMIENGVKLKVQFSSNSIVLDDESFDFNPATGVFYPEEVPELYYRNGKTFYFVINEKYYSIILHDDGSIDVSFFREYTKENGDLGVTGSWKNYIKEGGNNSGSDSGTGSLDFSLVGEWSYQINGNVNTSLTINSDNTFEFIGGGATSYSGSYSLSGNKITFEFDQNASMNIKDTFVVSGSDTEMTLTLEKSVSTYNGQENVSTSMSSLLQIFYNIITSTSVTLSK